VTTLLKAFFTAVVGLALGLWATDRLLNQNRLFASRAIGAWAVEDPAGGADSDPYTRARIQRNGEIPMALGEGLRLIARGDDTGRPFDPRCLYRIGPHAPPARYWTLELVDRAGFPVENPAQRYVLRSSEILREGDGSFAIWISALAHAGNWLPVGAPGRFALVLRLYDSSLGATVGGVEKTAAPSVVKERCE
jgi:hypothetical protein